MAIDKKTCCGQEKFQVNDRNFAASEKPIMSPYQLEEGL